MLVAQVVRVVLEPAQPVLAVLERVLLVRAPPVQVLPVQAA
ncbi:hypothetical protein [Onishia taeanensis]